MTRIVLRKGCNTARAWPALAGSSHGTGLHDNPLCVLELYGLSSPVEALLVCEVACVCSRLTHGMLFLGIIPAWQQVVTPFEANIQQSFKGWQAVWLMEGGGDFSLFSWHSALHSKYCNMVT